MNPRLLGIHTKPLQETVGRLTRHYALLKANIQPLAGTHQGMFLTVGIFALRIA